MGTTGVAGGYQEYQVCLKCTDNKGGSHENPNLLFEQGEKPNDARFMFEEKSWSTWSDALALATAKGRGYSLPTKDEVTYYLEKNTMNLPNDNSLKYWIPYQEPTLKTEDYVNAGEGHPTFSKG